jgi:hypothetical protein
MMYRTIWSSGIRHPDVAAYVSSGCGSGATDTGGYGGELEVRINTSPASEAFGEVSGVEIKNAGHEYANPDGGILWELMDVALGEEIFSATANLMALFPWGLIYSLDVGDSSEYILVDGTMPPVIPRRSACVFDECYHSLINASYVLYRMYSPTPTVDGNRIPANGSLAGVETSGFNNAWIAMGVKYLPANPPYSLGVFRRRSAVPNELGNYKSSDFMFLEWGQTLSLVAPIPTSIPAACPDHSDGRTGPW